VVVQRAAAHPRTLEDLLDRDIAVVAFHEEVVGGLDDGLPRTFAGTSSRSLHFDRHGYRMYITD
jgi:hypothetical protein